MGEILKNEQLTEQGKININLAIQNTDNLSDLASNLINFEKEELYTPNVYVSRYELNSYIKSYIEQFKLYAEKNKLKFILNPILLLKKYGWIETRWIPSSET